MTTIQVHRFDNATIIVTKFGYFDRHRKFILTQGDNTVELDTSVNDDNGIRLWEEWTDENGELGDNDPVILDSTEEVKIVRFYTETVKDTMYQLRTEAPGFPEEINEDTYEKLSDSVASHYERVNKEVQREEPVNTDVTVINRDFMNKEDYREDVESVRHLIGDRADELIENWVISQSERYVSEENALEYFHKVISKNDTMISSFFSPSSIRKFSTRGVSLKINYHAEPWIEREKMVPQLTKSGRPYADGRKTRKHVAPKIKDTMILHGRSDLDSDYEKKEKNRHARINIEGFLDDQSLSYEEINDRVNELLDRVTYGILEV